MPVVYWLSLWTVTGLDEMWRPAWMGEHAGAEVVVITPGSAPGDFSAAVLPMWQMDRFVREHSDYSFLIPAGGDEES